MCHRSNGSCRPAGEVHPWASAIITVFGSDGVASSGFDLAAHVVRFLLLVSFFPLRTNTCSMPACPFGRSYLWMTPIVNFLSALPPSNSEYQQCHTAVFQNVSHKLGQRGEQMNSTCPRRHSTFFYPSRSSIPLSNLSIQRDTWGHR